MNSCGSALTTIIQQFLYPVTDAPKFKKGFPASLGFIIGMCGWVFIVRYFELRTLKQKALDAEIERLEDGSDEGREAVSPIEVQIAEKS